MHVLRPVELAMKAIIHLGNVEDTNQHAPFHVSTATTLQFMNKKIYSKIIYVSVSDHHSSVYSGSMSVITPVPIVERPSLSVNL